MSLELKGIIPPILTPFTESQEVDEEALRREIQFFIAVGVHGISVNGSTGEGVMLTPEESRRICEIAVEEVNGRVPVISGVIPDSTREAVRLGHLAKEAGADALMITPVHYVHIPTCEGIFDYYHTIGREVGLPMIIYNVVPQVDISPELCLKLTEIQELVAIKQSSGDFHKLTDMIRVVGDRITVLSALDDLLFPSFAVGSPGGIAAIMAVLPELCVRLYNAVSDSDFEEARRLHYRILPVVRAILGDNFPSSAKMALRLLGRPVGPARSPLTAPTAEEENQIRRALAEAGVLGED